METITVNLLTVSHTVLHGLLAHTDPAIRLAARKEITRRARAGAR